MPDYAPLARSPIAPAPPVLVSHGWEISGARSSAALRITDCAPLAKVQVRADPDGPAARALDARFGRAFRTPDDTLVVGSGPGEWMLFGAPGSAEAGGSRCDVPRPRSRQPA